MYSACDDIRLRMPGCPIRKSPDQSLLGGSPELFAASYVLHRLLAPRHPPCALSSLTTQRPQSASKTAQSIAYIAYILKILLVDTLLFSCQRPDRIASPKKGSITSG